MNKISRFHLVVFLVILPTFVFAKVHRPKKKKRHSVKTVAASVEPSPTPSPSPFTLPTNVPICAPNTTPAPTPSPSPAKEPFLPDMQASLSIDMGTSYLIPSLSFQNMISNNFAWGAKLGVLSFSSQADKHLVLDAFGTLDHYFSRRLFYGPWLSAGLGVYRFHLTSGALEETAYSPAARFTVGWRLPVGYHLNLAGALGAQYLFKKQGDIFVLDLSGLLGLATVEISYMF